MEHNSLSEALVRLVELFNVLEKKVFLSKCLQYLLTNASWMEVNVEFRPFDYVRERE